MKNRRKLYDPRHKEEEEEAAEEISGEILNKQIARFEKELVSLGSRPLIHDFRLLKEELELRFQKYAEETETDSLTKAKNKKGLESLLKLEIARAKRANHGLSPEKPAYMFSVAMISIDNFKEINGTYGHLMEDYLIKLLADSLNKAKKRETDAFGRYSEEEFVLILPNSPPEKARENAIIPFRELFYERSKAKLAGLSKSEPLIAGSKKSDVAGISLSIGITNYPLISKSPDALAIISDADEAMYKARELSSAANDNDCKGSIAIYEKKQSEIPSTA